MHFIVLGYDGNDKQALERRLAGRKAHLEMGKKLHEKQKWIYAAATLDKEGKMNGSIILCNFKSEEELHKEWLDHEPYVKGKVWEKVEVKRVQPAAFDR